MNWEEKWMWRSFIPWYVKISFNWQENDTNVTSQEFHQISCISIHVPCRVYCYEIRCYFKLMWIQTHFFFLTPSELVRKGIQMTHGTCYVDGIVVLIGKLIIISMSFVTYFLLKLLLSAPGIGISKTNGFLGYNEGEIGTWDAN